MSGLSPERSLVCPRCGTVRPDEGGAVDGELFREVICAECAKDDEELEQFTEFADLLTDEAFEDL